MTLAVSMPTAREIFTDEPTEADLARAGVVFDEDEPPEPDAPAAPALTAPAQTQAPATAPARADDYATDTRHAEGFAARYGDVVRFDHRRKRWYFWEAPCWRPDADQAVLRLAMEYARERQRAALDIVDAERRGRAFRDALKLETRQKIDAMLTLARAVLPIADAGDRWDADPWLLACPNGVVDLKTGMLRAGRPEDRLTHLAGVPFDAAAPRDRWYAFLDDVFVDPELIAFVQRAAGYTLTGCTGEQVLFLLEGRGANGKGTLSRAFMKVLGDYAVNMSFATLEQGQQTTTSNDLAALVGRRFIMASETNDGSRWNEARVKALTGCDPITARFLYGEFFTFVPVGKFWLSVNHKPGSRDDSHAFWRRMRLLKFERTFPVNDKFEPHLFEQLPGVLAWMVEGCRYWQEHGLQPPASVVEATSDYREDCDVLGDFIREACVVDDEASVQPSALFQHYRSWAESRGMKDREVLTQKAFSLRMKDRFKQDRTSAMRAFVGIGKRGLLP